MMAMFSLAGRAHARSDDWMKISPNLVRGSLSVKGGANVAVRMLMLSFLLRTLPKLAVGQDQRRVSLTG